MEPVATLTFNPAVDVSTSVPRVVPEDKLRCAAPRREPGGGGVNVSRAVLRLGGTSVAVHTAGGPPGEVLGALLDDEGVDRRAVPVADWTRESWIVSEETSTLQYRFGMPGPTLTEVEVEACLDRLRDLDPAPAYVVASGSLPPGAPPDLYVRVADVARRLGARLVLDTSGEPLRRAVWDGGGAFLLKPNLRELQALAGDPLDTEAAQVAFARRLVDEGRCGAAVVSLGPAGALFASPAGAEYVRTPTVPIRSKVGAGDSTVAGMVLALARGATLAEAVRFGMAAGAAAVMTPGTELCRREDAERLYAEGMGG